MMNTPTSNAPVKPDTTAEELRNFDWSGVSDIVPSKADKDKRCIETLTRLTRLQAEVIAYQDGEVSQEIAGLKSQILVTNRIIMVAIVIGALLWLL